MIRQLCVHDYELLSIRKVGDYIVLQEQTNVRSRIAMTTIDSNVFVQTTFWNFFHVIAPLITTATLCAITNDKNQMTMVKNETTKNEHETAKNTQQGINEF